MEAALVKATRLYQRYGFTLPYCVLAWAAMLITLNAWVAEDAYITFRVVDNFLNGYGLRWNIHERVQVYTHPLWMLLHIPFTAGLWNIFLANIILSIACSTAALWLVLKSANRPPMITIATLFIPLLLSKSFMDYTTSGLENPMSYLLFAAFGYVLLNFSNHPRFWLYLSLTVALALVNRLDVSIIYAPAIAYIALSRFRHIRWRQVLLGASPLIAWFSFALFYYGFIFPNTKYAKLNTGLDWLLYLNQGIQYLKHLCFTDTPGALLMFSSLLFLFLPTHLNDRAPRLFPHLPQALAIGIYIYLFYVINIGGDYMAGRFWAFPIFVSGWMLYAFLPTHKRPDFAAIAAMVSIASYLCLAPLANIRNDCKTCLPVKGRIIDSIFIFHQNKLVAKQWPLKLRREGKYKFANDGRRFAEQWEVTAQKIYFIGMPGYYAGPQAPLVDELALADPLLARLPAASDEKFFAAHFRRDIPKGYYHAIQTGSLGQMDPLLALYYQPLRLITSGNLLDIERLKTIMLFNIGYYEKWKEAYLANRT